MLKFLEFSLAFSKMLCYNMQANMKNHPLCAV